MIRNGEGKAQTTEIMSPIHGSTVGADAKAFRAFMKHLKEFDGEQYTVIMVQVENEVGILGDSRDYSAAASKVFESPVPADLLRFIREEWDLLHKDLRAKLQMNLASPAQLVEGKKWSTTFDESVYTDEMFMAYHYARYIQQVAEAGKAEYPLPMFANFWQNYGEDQMARQYPTLAGGGSLPGDYPSGGAVSNVLDIWMQFAPALDFLSPDTYLNDYHRICSTYRHRNQPLFIPEQRRDEYGARRIWAAIGSYQAIGACPFALDTLEVDSCAFKKHYALLGQVADEILAAQRKAESMVGFFFDEPGHRDESIYPRPVVEMGGYELSVEHAFTTGSAQSGYGIVILLGTSPDRTASFLLVGAGFQVKFRSLHPGAHYTGILQFEEKVKVKGGDGYITRRLLNGDETRSGKQAIMPNDEPDTGGFPININIPAVTKIAKCTIYDLVR